MAAVHAALWASTNRQAALLLSMAVQQRLVTADEIAAALLRVRRDVRRQFIEGVVLDQNDVVLAGDTVLRLPLLGLRTAPDDFYAQIAEALRRGGWQGRLAS